MTDASEDRWPYAYQEHNRPSDNRPTIQAFATSHLPSPWMADRGVFQVMPSPLVAPDVDRAARALGFDHADELDGPHRYRVVLDEGVVAEMTAGEFALGWRFTGVRSVVLDHHGVLRSCSVRIEDGTAVVDALLDDRAETPPHHVHVRITGAVAEHTSFVDGELRGWVEVGGDADVLLGISTVSAEDAAANLDVAGDFDRMRRHAEDRWETELDTLRVEGATEDQLVSLYSGLHRAFLYPTRAGETALTGTPRHRSPYGAVLSEPIRDARGPEVVDGPLTTTNGFWDTYRTAWPLLALLTPDAAADLAEGVVGHFTDGGWTPRWSAPGAEDVMTGTTSDTVFADLVAKGVDGFDVEQAYRSAVRNATVPSPDRRVGRKGSLPGDFRGHVDTATGEGMSWTLDAAINDWGVAVLAQAMAERAAAGGDADGEPGTGPSTSGSPAGRCSTATSSTVTAASSSVARPTAPGAPVTTSTPTCGGATTPRRTPGARCSPPRTTGPASSTCTAAPLPSTPRSSASPSDARPAAPTARGPTASPSTR